MGKQKKKTKKFKKDHLHNEIAKRKAAKRIKDKKKISGYLKERKQLAKEDEQSENQKTQLISQRDEDDEVLDDGKKKKKKKNKKSEPVESKLKVNKEGEQKEKKGSDEKSLGLDLDKFLESGFFAEDGKDLPDDDDDEEGDDEKEDGDREATDDEEDEKHIPTTLHEKKTQALVKSELAALDDDNEGGDVEEDGGDLTKEIEKHKKELQNLKTTDPEFYAMLEKEGKDLLNFNVSSGDEAEEPEEEEENKSKKQEVKKKTPEEKKKEAEEKKKELEKARLSKMSADVEGLTMEKLKALCRRFIKSHSLITIKKLVNLFRSAAHVGDDAKTGAQDKPLEETTRKFANSRVYNALVRFCLRTLPRVLKEELLRDPIAPTEIPHKKLTKEERQTKKEEETKEIENKKKAGEKIEEKKEEERDLDSELQKTVIKKLPRFEKLQVVIRRFLGALLHFLNQLVDTTMARFVLQTCHNTIPLFQPFSEFSLRLLKILLRIWSTSSDSNTRIDAFLRIRQLCLATPPRDQLLDQALKGIYLTYVRNSKFVTAPSAPMIEFMQKCVVELYGIDIISSYQHAFVYIRQLAMHLRSTMINITGSTFAAKHKNKTKSKTKGKIPPKEKYRTVASWQFINCLKVWGQILANYGQPTEQKLNRNIENKKSSIANNKDEVDDEQDDAKVSDWSSLSPLVYPFVQICLGVLQLLSSPRYVPLQLNVASILIQLANQVDVYIPVASYLLHVLALPDFLRKPTKVNVSGALNLKYLLKVSEKTAGSRAYQDAVVSRTVQIMLEYFSTWSHSISFPELIIPTVIQLKKIIKKAGKGHVRLIKECQTAIKQLTSNASFVTQSRNEGSSGELAPKDFDPSGGHSVKRFGKDPKSLSPLQKYVTQKGKEYEEEEKEQETQEQHVEKDSDEEEAEEGEEKQGKKGTKRKSRDDDTSEKQAKTQRLTLPSDDTLAVADDAVEEPEDEVQDFVLGPSDDEAGGKAEEDGEEEDGEEELE